MTWVAMRFSFLHIPSYEGISDKPTYEDAREVAEFITELFELLVIQRSTIFVFSIAEKCITKIWVITGINTINLNIKLDADVRLKIEKEATNDVKTKPIF